MKIIKRLQYLVLLWLFLFSSNLSFGQQAIAIEIFNKQQEQRKGLFDDIKRVVGGKNKICIAGLCVKTGQLTEAVFAKQFKDIAQKMHPLLSAATIYILSRSLFRVIPSNPIF